MAVIAVFTYEVKPGRMQDFLLKLAEAGSPRFTSTVMPKSLRLFRSTAPGPETRYGKLFIEYEDMAAYGARTDFEQTNTAWRQLFEERPDAPERLVSVELLSELTP